MVTENKDQYVQLKWDIFCRVVDNFGDAGVSWRLARQLQLDYRQSVRLWVDDINSLAKIAPQIKSDLIRQYWREVEIQLWQDVFIPCEPADVVIEMFACELPEIYVEKMVKKTRAPVWLNLEYLSAEAWVQEYHGLPSPHPRLPLTKTFFFPGFVPDTGGLLREKNLIERINAFNAEKQQQFWHSNGVRQRVKDECRVSLFCYDHAPVEALIAVWTRSPVPVFLVIPEGSVADRVVMLLSAGSIRCGNVIQSGQLSVQVIPFLEQERYDQLLWACDLNFVRGEDSFVRAQWAGKPFVWHIYPQSDNVHWKKLDAFLNLYAKHMPERVFLALQKFWYGWNAVNEIDESTWLSLHDCLGVLHQFNADWRNKLVSQNDLAFNLIQFAGNRL